MRRPSDGLIHHSDRATQYLIIQYTGRLADAGLVGSVGSVGSRATARTSTPSSQRGRRSKPRSAEDSRRRDVSCSPLLRAPAAESGRPTHRAGFACAAFHCYARDPNASAPRRRSSNFAAVPDASARTSRFGLGPGTRNLGISDLLAPRLLGLTLATAALRPHLTGGDQRKSTCSDFGRDQSSARQCASRLHKKASTALSSMGFNRQAGGSPHRLRSGSKHSTRVKGSSARTMLPTVNSPAPGTRRTPPPRPRTVSTTPV